MKKPYLIPKDSISFFVRIISFPSSGFCDDHSFQKECRFWYPQYLQRVRWVPFERRRKKEVCLKSRSSTSHGTADCYSVAHVPAQTKSMTLLPSLERSMMSMLFWLSSYGYHTATLRKIFATSNQNRQRHPLLPSPCQRRRYEYEVVRDESSCRFHQKGKDLT